MGKKVMVRVQKVILRMHFLKNALIETMSYLLIFSLKDLKDTQRDKAPFAEGSGALIG